MKRFSRSKKNLALMSAVLLLLSCVFGFSPLARLQVYAQPYATQPSLGTASNFAVLGGSTVTNTGSTAVHGDVGVSPESSVTGFPPGSVSGTIHAGDAVALQAQNDLATAYANAVGQSCNVPLSGQDLGGQILTSGVYCFATSAQLTGQLTLDGQGNPASVFIFQIGSTLTTANNASVLLINGAQACNIFWQVGSSATLGTDTHFTGNILASSSITSTTGALSNGSLYAHNGAVTLDTNTITRTRCSTLTFTAPATVTVSDSNTTHQSLFTFYSTVVDDRSSTAGWNFQASTTGLNISGEAPSNTVFPTFNGASATTYPSTAVGTPLDGGTCATPTASAITLSNTPTEFFMAPTTTLAVNCSYAITINGTIDFSGKLAGLYQGNITLTLLNTAAGS